MTCIERCYIWKLKNELLKTLNVTRESRYPIHLLNSIKNERRLKILEILSSRRCNIKEIQQYLRREGYYHSCSTIKNTYVKPLMNTGLVKIENGKYKLTLYGKKIHNILSKGKFKEIFLGYSSCKEEFCLRALITGPKTHDELAASLSKADLRRVIKKLKKKRLIARIHPAARVLFYATEKESIKGLSPTERRVLDIVLKTDGISVHDISNKVGITLRRAYKYLNKLRKKKLVLRQRKATLYILTPKGKEVADYLEKVCQFANGQSALTRSFSGKDVKKNE